MQTSSLASPRHSLRALATSAIIAFLTLTSSASATTLSAIGSLTVGRSGVTEIKKPAPMLGAEYTLSLSDRLQLGAFYHHNFLNYSDSTTGGLRYFGTLLRLRASEDLLRAAFFADASLGLSRRTRTEDGSPNRFSYGAGGGYDIPLSEKVSLKPRGGVRFLADAPDASASNAAELDLGVVLSFRF